MSSSTQFVDVILPLALPRLLTYRVPKIFDDRVVVGQRIIVQLGKNKMYTALVRRIHHQAPGLYEAKYLEDVLDDAPILQEEQFQLWEWMAEYYACTLGEVMIAALPGGLKLTSETKFQLAESFIDEHERYSAKEWVILEALHQQPSMTLADVSSLLEQRNVQQLMKALIEKGAIVAEEEIKEKFKPKKTDFVVLHKKCNNEKFLNTVFEDLETRRARKQSEALMMYLRLSGWDSGQGKEVKRLELQQAADVPASLIQAMVEKEIFSIINKETGRLDSSLLASEQPRALSGIQQQAYSDITSGWETHDVSLLHGVTGSGKTEVYTQLIQRVIDEGKQVLFLLPEIALTTQIIHRLKRFFGKRIGVYHSGYSDNERTEIWTKVLSDIPGECDIILGARSSLFLPYSRLGLVIVDEEHEQSFKQHDPAPRYHARDTAIVLAQRFKAKVVLGSATPSLESYFNAQQKRYHLVEMNERYSGIELPEIVICDIRQELKAKTMQNNFSSLLLNEIKQTIEAGKQVILFQNRRGFSPLWQCHSCSWIPMCSRCDVSLTYHKKSHQLKCHYCGYSMEPPPACHSCGSTDLRMLGFGTEKLEEELAEMLEGVIVQRMDLDTTRSKNAYQKIIGDFESGHIQVLVGTQMVTKGLDFDNVALVGIMSADRMMNFPDFRSMERSFQVMMQVAGRAGRREQRGKVIIQTYAPEHWLLDLVKRGDYVGMYHREISERHKFHYPPFLRLVRLTIKHKDEDVADRAAQAIGQVLRSSLGDRVLGPEKPIIPRINTYYLQQIQVKLARSQQLAEQKRWITEKSKEVLLLQAFKSVRLSIDVDPV